MVDVSLSLLEQHCQELESVKQGTTSVVEDQLPLLKQQATHIRSFYQMIDRMESVVREIRATTDRMEQEMSLAEDLFSTPSFRVPKVLSSLLTSRKKRAAVTPIRYTPPAIFDTRRLFSRTECEEGTEVCEDDESPPTLFSTAGHSVPEQQDT